MRQQELVPLPIRLIPIYRDREIGYMVGMAESKMIVVPDEFRGFDYPAMIDRLSHQWPSLEHVYVIGENVPARHEATFFIV